ncbi:flavin reductase family protein [Streptacidiphilus sp. 4-A2]|nr:flavin reductase family protein [Streptacidiphilus sp. 4-A2]
MAVAAIRYLRATAAPESYQPPRPALHAVRADERPTVADGPPDPGPAAPDSALLRSVLGHFCTGVTVVSAVTADGSPVGFACQSFGSLSLEPPLVSFSVARSSASWPRIARAGAFCVSVLAADQGALCRTFAVSSATGADKFAGVDWTPAPATGAPRLTGALAWVDCTIHAVHTGGDHLIVLGRVAGLATTRTDAGPLLFYRGGFGEFSQ